jgi:tetratricopeptide (TPR) repeat protein
MMKQVPLLAGMFVVLIALGGCSSPEEKAAGYIENAGELFQEGKLKKAEIEYKNALQINQNLPDAWYGLAKIHERKRDWKGVYAVLSKVRELAPNHLDGRIMLGQLMLASNQLDQALSDATEILEIAPNDARSHSLMAAVQYRLENFDGAQQEIDKALAIDAANVEALLVRARILIAEKRYDDALTELDDAIEANRENVSLYLMKIQAFTELDNRGAVTKVYLALIDQFPDNVNFKQALARFYINNKEIDSAERILKELTESSSENIDYKLRFVAFKRQFRSSGEAIALLESYIAADADEFRYRILLGELYEKDKQSSEALRVYEGIVADDGVQPNGLEARNKIALIRLREGNRDSALNLINEVLAQDKNNEDALLMQAGIQLADKEYDDAIVSVRTVLRDHPDSIRAMAILAKAHEASGSHELAIETYSRAFQLSPGSPVIANPLAAKLLSQRKATQANEILQKSLANGNRSVDTFKLFAQVKLALGEWDKAEQLARQLQNFKGEEAHSQQLLGVVYQGKDKLNESIEAFKRAHELAPDATQPVVALVRAFVRSGKADEARQFLAAILKVDADNYTAHLLMGELDMADGTPVNAIEHFNAAIKSNPEQEIGYRRLAWAYTSLDDTDKAEEVLKQAIAAMPERPILSIGLASNYERRGEFDKAIEVYRSLLESNNELLVARNNLASLLTDQRKDQESFEQARAISAELKDSPIPQFRDTYAWASVVAGTNLEEAVLILEGVVRENDQVDIYTYHLGEAYRRKGDSENAIAYLNKAVELAAENSDIAGKAKQSLQQIQ